MARSAQRITRRASVVLALTLALCTAAPPPADAFFFAEQRKECGDGTVVLIFQVIPALFAIVVLPKGKPPLTESSSAITLDEDIDDLCEDLAPPAGRATLSAAAAVLPVDAAVGDFDRDGHPDVAIANQGSSNVSVSFGKPDGSFQPAVEYATGAGPVRIVAGRFDADVRLDLLTANVGNGLAGDLSLLRGKGKGGFRAPMSITAGTLPVDVAVGDFNGDTKPDLVAATSSTNPMVLRLGNGDGTFQPEIPLTVTTVRSVVVARLNDDVHDDLVTNRGVALGNGNGTFQALVPFSGGIAPTVVRAGDVNGDDALDVVALSLLQNVVSVMLGNGDGTLQPPRHYVTGNRPTEVAIVDLDGDDAVDLLVSNAGDDHLSILHGNGDGTFDSPSAYSTVASLATRSGSVDAAVADFTGDDVPDVVAANGSAASLLAGIGGGALAPFAPLAGLFGDRVLAGDWNGNGAADLALTGSGKLTIALGNDDGTFGAPSQYALSGSDSFPDFLAQAFLDAGTRPDLLVANTGAGSVAVFLGDGSSGFTEKPAVPIGTMTNSVATGDFDHDGHADLVATHLGGFGALNGSVKLAFGNGDGTFGTPQVLRGGSVAPDSVVVADFDRNGEPDVACVVEGPLFDWDVEVLLGKGDGAFAAPAPLGLPYDLVHTLRTADFDGDGNPDLAVSLEGTRAAVLLGKGNGRFHPPVLFDTGGGATLPADLDRDALPDIVASSGVGLTAVLINVADEQGAKYAPDTTITGGKKVYKTGKPKHPFNVRFTTDEPGSSFQCRLKRLAPVKNVGSWGDCTSPYRKRLAPGKFQFLVRAIDVAGNVDVTPAKLGFKVVAQ
jgi:hypothetical protein